MATQVQELIRAIDPSLLRAGLIPKTDRTIARPYEVFQVDLTETNGYKQARVAPGKTLWIRNGGNVNNFIALGYEPPDGDDSDEEKRLTLAATDNMWIRIPFAKLWYRITSAGASVGSKMEIVIFAVDVWIGAFDPTGGGGSPITATAALPVYHAEPGGTTEGSAPVYLSPSGGSAAMSSRAYPYTPAVDVATELLSTSAHHTAKLIAETSTTLGGGANYLGTVVDVLVDSGLEGDITTEGDVGLHYSGLGATAAANVIGHVRPHVQVAGSGNLRIHTIQCNANEAVTYHGNTSGARQATINYSNGGSAQATFNFNAVADMTATLHGGASVSQ